MARQEKNWTEMAQECARDTMVEYIDTIAEMARDGEVSDDLLNDYGHGDSYHHETHVDRWYNLTDAADLLDELSQHEETDSGLWQGESPRDAISTQAAFTFGNAVYYYWRLLVEELNSHLDSFQFDDITDPDSWREGFAYLWVNLMAHYASEKRTVAKNHQEYDIARNAQDELEKDGTVDGVLVLADYLEDQDGNTMLYRKLRKYAEQMQEACKEEEEAEEEAEAD